MGRRKRPVLDVQAMFAALSEKAAAAAESAVKPSTDARRADDDPARKRLRPTKHASTGPDSGDIFSTHRATQLSPRQSRTTAARQAVFQTPELLENILVHLPPKTILAIQRVSQGSRNAVANSPAIREKLFLRRKGGSEKAWALDSVAYGRQHCIPVSTSPFTYAMRVGPHSGSTSADLDLDDGIVPKEVSLCSSVLDTYICDPPCQAVLCVDIRFDVGNRIYKVVADKDISAMTWKEILQRVLISKDIDLYRSKRLTTKPKTRSMWKVVDSEHVPGLKRESTVEQKIFRLEKMAGWKAVITRFTCNLDEVGIPDNEDWKTTGMAPSNGAKEVTDV